MTRWNFGVPRPSYRVEENSMLLRMLVFVVALLSAAVARADGFVIILPPETPRPIPMPHPVPRPPRPAFFPLGVKTHLVNVGIEGRVATTEIDQVFTNPNQADLEGTYIFPLPEDATVSKFSLFMNGKEVEAELLDADKARSIYEGIVRQMRDPALLEYAGRGMFKARVYPIPARGEARVRLAYQQVIRAEGGLCEYRYPLSTEKWSSSPLEEARVTVTVKGADGASIVNVFSPSHDVRVEKGLPTTARWEVKNALPDRDFVLYFQEARGDRAVDVSVVTHRPAGEDGYFLMLLSPPADLPQNEPMPKDVVFVVDTSGSMAGEKMDQAKGALRYCLRSLLPGDRFALIDFATEVRRFREGLLAPTQEIVAAAVEYVDGMKSRGGTAIHDALMAALSLQGGEGRPFMIVFVTDGAPTIGVTKPEDIEKAVKGAREARADKDDVRLFVFGVGTDLNASLLDRLAEENRGAREYVAPQESIEVKVSRFFDKVSSPVFAGVKLDIPGLEAYDVYPRPIPDLFRGGEVVITGRYRAGGAKAVQLGGKLRGRAATVVAKCVFPDEAKAAFVPRVFATRKIGFLLDQVRLHGETDEVRKEIIRLAKEHGIVTPYTSYLVVEDEKQLGMNRPEGDRHAMADIGERLRRSDEYRRFEEAERRAYDIAGATKAGRTPPPGTPAPRDSIAAGEAAKKLAEAPLSGAAEPTAPSGSSFDQAGRFAGSPTQTGAGGGAAGPAREQELAQLEKARKDTDAILRESVRVVAGRTFYRQGETWVDARFKAGMEVERVPYLSDAYFALARSRADLGRFLALGERVKIVDGARAIEVTLEE